MSRAALTGSIALLYLSVFLTNVFAIFRSSSSSGNLSARGGPFLSPFHTSSDCPFAVSMMLNAPRGFEGTNWDSISKCEVSAATNARAFRA